jgi:hypothetical protein
MKNDLPIIQFEQTITPKIMAEFSLFGDDFDLTYVTELLGLEPTRSYKKGEQTRSRGNGSNKFIETVWEISTKYENTFDINEPLAKLIDLISGLEDKIVEIQNKFNIKCQICIIISMYADNMPSMYFNKETISFFNSIKADVAFDNYCFIPDNEDCDDEDEN